MFFPYLHKKIIKILCERNKLREIEDNYFDSIILVFEYSEFILLEVDYDHDEIVMQEIDNIPTNIDYVTYYPTFAKDRELKSVWVCRGIYECDDLLLLGINKSLPNFAIYSSCEGLEIFEINLNKL